MLHAERVLVDYLRMSTSIHHWQGRRTMLPNSFQADRLEEARYDAWVGNDTNHSRLGATMRRLLKSMANTRFSRTIPLRCVVHALAVDSSV